jgi:hypothetical protein
MEEFKEGMVKWFQQQPPGIPPEGKPLGTSASRLVTVVLASNPSPKTMHERI